MTTKIAPKLGEIWDLKQSIDEDATVDEVANFLINALEVIGYEPKPKDYFDDHK